LQLDLTASHLLDVCTVRLPCGTVRARPRVAHLTPAELICVPDRASLADVKRIVTDAFAEVYKLAVKWRCEQLLGLPEDALVPAGELQQAGSSGDAAAAGVADASQLLLLGEKVPPGCELTAVGSGLDPEPR
jgi:hypothetical protein